MTVDFLENKNTWIMGFFAISTVSVQPGVKLGLSHLLLKRIRSAVEELLQESISLNQEERIGLQFSVSTEINDMVIEVDDSTFCNWSVCYYIRLPYIGINNLTVDLEYTKQVVDAMGGVIKLSFDYPNIEGAMDSIKQNLINEIAGNYDLYKSKKPPLKM
ncbi:MAG: hypothetical protein AAFR36_17920 [Bacteroidota bacterium]